MDPCRRDYSRSELFQLIGTLTFIDNSLMIELLLQPRKVSYKSSTIADVALPKTFQLRLVLDGFEIGDRGASYRVVILAKSISYCQACSVS